MGEQDFAKVLTGTLSNVNFTNTVAEVFFVQVTGKAWPQQASWLLPLAKVGWLQE